ncbi:hypothetical protein MMYC01_205970 [Madurella mycetomatis]|uniref:Rhodopsin domain-containing protein n=1 Tax=Madurella mycetomatis TaxID=100816 RepID=A0A175W274_9PEZI|nr:hypothetical protein MMYC01_205970 [Madurella mycetomatis]
MSSAAPAPGDGLAAPNGTVPLNGTAPLIPPGIPVSDQAAYLAQVYIGVTSTLMALCIITFCTRIYQRVVPVWKVGLDDYFIVAGFILTVADWAMLFPQMVITPGLIPIERGVEAGKHSWLAIPIWGLSMTCIKISIALTLLRIQGNHRGWRIFLYTVIGVQAIYGIGNTIFDLAIACQPLAAAWDMTIPGAAPATFLRKLNRPLRERVFVCVLMGMGLFASGSSIVKTVIIKDWGEFSPEVDFWAMGVSICTWTALEQLLGVLAACVPAMKGTFQRCLGAVGVSLTESRSQQRSGYYARQRSGVGGASIGAGDLTASGTLKSQQGHDDTLRSVQRFSRGGILKEQTVVVEYDEEVCIDMPEIRRDSATKSSIGSSGSQSPGESRGKWVEHLPAHAV